MVLNCELRWSSVSGTTVAIVLIVALVIICVLLKKGDVNVEFSLRPFKLKLDAKHRPM